MKHEGGLPGWRIMFVVSGVYGIDWSDDGGLVARYADAGAVSGER